MNCWEYRLCGRERGGRRSHEFGVCPAWPRSGQRCAEVIGTFCGGSIQDDLEIKLTNREECSFYQSEHFGKNSTRPEKEGR